MNLVFNSKDIASFEVPVIREPDDRAEFRQGFTDRVHFSSAACRTGIRQYGEFGYHDGRVLNEDGIRLVIQLGKLLDLTSKEPQGVHVGGMLGPGMIQIDRLLVHVGQFTIVDGLTDGSDESNRHGGFQKVIAGHAW